MNVVGGGTAVLEKRGIILMTYSSRKRSGMSVDAKAREHNMKPEREAQQQLVYSNDEIGADLKTFLDDVFSSICVRLCTK